MVEINANGVRIRELFRKDIPNLVEISQDLDIQRNFFGDYSPFTTSHWENKIEDQIWDRYCLRPGGRSDYFLGIESNGELSGVVDIDVRKNCCRFQGETYHWSFIGFFVGSEYRRQGIAETSLRLLIPYAFNEIGSGKVSSSALKENIASQNLLKKVGLKEKWRGVGDERPVIGQEIVVFGLERGEFEKVAA